MGNKFERKFNGDLYLNVKQGRRDRGKQFDREKLIKQLMRDEGLSWKEAARRIGS